MLHRQASNQAMPVEDASHLAQQGQRQSLLGKERYFYNTVMLLVALGFTVTFTFTSFTQLSISLQAEAALDSGPEGQAQKKKSKSVHKPGWVQPASGVSASLTPIEFDAALPRQKASKPSSSTPAAPSTTSFRQLKDTVKLDTWDKVRAVAL